MKETITLEEIKAEIENLKADPFVKLARQAEREKYKERQRLYTLRYLAKKGREIANIRNKEEKE